MTGRLAVSVMGDSVGAKSGALLQLSATRAARIHTPVAQIARRRFSPGSIRQPLNYRINMRLHVPHRQYRLDFRGARGYAMAALLVSIAVMGILMSVALPAWRQATRREKEADLVFRGEQYARAIGLYQRRFAGAFPPSIDVLVEQKFLRRKYKDPMTEDGEFQVLYQASLAASAPGDGSAPSTFSGSGSQTRPSGPTSGAGPRGGVIGVLSKSEEESIRLYNDRDHYNEWLFVYIATTTQVGGLPGVQQGDAGRRQQGRPQGQFRSEQRGGGGGRGGRESPGGQGQRPAGGAGRPPGGRPTPSPGRPPG